MLASDWLPILESHQDELLDEIGLYGYEFVQGGGPFGNTLEYRPGAQWLVLEAVHYYDGSKKAVRVPIHDRFAQNDHLERLRYVSAKLKEQDADWFLSLKSRNMISVAMSIFPLPSDGHGLDRRRTYASAMWKNRTNPHELDYLDCQLSNLIQEMRDGGLIMGMFPSPT